MTVKEALEARFGASPTVPAETESLLDIATRGVCRSYGPDPVDPALVETLCALALCSPSKSDLQQRDIIIVRDRKIRATLDRLTGFDWQPAAPVLLVFCATHIRFHDSHRLAGVPMANHHLDGFFNAAVDAGIALSAFVSAAERVGLGCCPLSVIRNHASEVSDLLGLPDLVLPVAGLTVGWPTRSPRIAPRLSLDATVHIDRFGQDRDAGLREYDGRRPMGPGQRLTERFGAKAAYGWTDDKARQYADPQRDDFGAFVRSRGFSLE